MSLHRLLRARQSYLFSPAIDGALWSSISTNLSSSLNSPFISCLFFFISHLYNGQANGLAKTCLATHLVLNL
ncbi:unnamed protein product [Brassica rapa subsp. trilocularis]